MIDEELNSVTGLPKKELVWNYEKAEKNKIVNNLNKTCSETF